MAISQRSLNRIGFIILGLTNNFGYVIMLAAAYDLLSMTTDHQPVANEPNKNVTTLTSLTKSSNSSTNNEKYCNPHSTATILLADTIPSLLIKLIYPFLLFNILTAYKVIATVILSILSFVITGLGRSELIIFTGVVFASLSSGGGEATLLSRTPLYSEESLSGWSIGTGMAGVLGAFSYAILSIILSTPVIMLVMLVVPLAMAYSYFCIIKPVVAINDDGGASYTDDFDARRLKTTSPGLAVCVTPPASRTPSPTLTITATAPMPNAELESVHSPQKVQLHLEGRIKNYGTSTEQQSEPTVTSPTESNSDLLINRIPSKSLSWEEKYELIPTLLKYFFPLLLVYFAEYFINQGLYELIYFPDATFFGKNLDKKVQYRWFQVAYQLGVMFSRSSIEFFRIEGIWKMSVLQLLNLILFLAHTTKLLHIPGFYLVLVIILYEGFLGGFSYVNTFYKITKELRPKEREFAISAVTMADSLGIVAAGFASIPAHTAICKMYN